MIAFAFLLDFARIHPSAEVKLSCRRDRAMLCSLNISLSHSRSFEMTSLVWYGKTRMVWLPDGEKV